MADNGFYEYLRTQNLLEPNPNRSLSVEQKKFQPNAGLAPYTSHVANLGGVHGSIAGFNQKLSSIYNSKGQGNFDLPCDPQPQHPAGGHARRHTQLADARNSSYIRPDHADFLSTMSRLGYVAGASDATQQKLWNHY